MCPTGTLEIQHVPHVAHKSVPYMHVRDYKEFIVDKLAQTQK